MASLGHVAVGLAAGRLHAGERGPRLASAVAFVVLSSFADADVLARAFGAGPGSAWVHRGALHSLAAGGVAALAVALATGGLGRSRGCLAACGFLVAASHGLLDALTDGGRGVALLWPFSDARVFAPVRPLAVAPIGLGMVSARGLHVLAAELVAFSPLLLVAVWPRRRRPPRATAPAA
jgi:inner membrane protein